MFKIQHKAIRQLYAAHPFATKPGGYVAVHNDNLAFMLKAFPDGMALTPESYLAVVKATPGGYNIAYYINTLSQNYDLYRDAQACLEKMFSQMRDRIRQFCENQINRLFADIQHNLEKNLARIEQQYNEAVESQDETRIVYVTRWRVMQIASEKAGAKFETQHRRKEKKTEIKKLRSARERSLAQIEYDCEQALANDLVNLFKSLLKIDTI